MLIRNEGILGDSLKPAASAGERENDVMREQLKKYVDMVQAQRRERLSSAKTTESAAQMTSSGDYIFTPGPTLFFLFFCSWYDIMLDILTLVIFYTLLCGILIKLVACFILGVRVHCYMLPFVLVHVLYV